MDNQEKIILSLTQEAVEEENDLKQEQDKD